MPNTTTETLGPAERTINMLLSYTDHLYHGRCGVVIPDATSPIGVKWIPVTHKEEDGKKIVYSLNKIGRKVHQTRMGELQDDNSVQDGARKVGEYRKPGLYPEVAAWMYKQAADVWKMNNEFSARWASYAFTQDHRDLKVVLAALMLVQNRKGIPIKENGEVVFFDDDFRDVGEAMILTVDRKDKKDLNPKLLLRIHDLLSLPEIAEINRDLGFGRSARKPFYGRWHKAVEKWIRYREDNSKLLNGLVKAGFRKTVMELSRRVGYKPSSPKYFETLRWKQAQAKDGRREIAIGKAVATAETWEGLSEAEICERIVKNPLSYKRIVGMVPASVGLTRAIVAASIEAHCLSDKDLIILTPTLEELGLLQDPEVKNRWEAAMKTATDTRAANIASRVKNQSTKDKLQEAADTAVKAAVEKEMDNIRIYFMVDISGSMQGAIEQAKVYLEKFLQAFPMDKIHISVFNTMGQEVKLRSSTGVGVRQAFSNYSAGGGTDYGSGVRALQHNKPSVDEDVLFIFIGDEGAADFQGAVNKSGLNPVAFGFLKVDGGWGYNRFAVQNTATNLGIPCFMIDENIFGDVYQLPRTLSALIQSTPVNREAIGRVVQKRVSLAELIMKTELLERPMWVA